MPRTSRTTPHTPAKPPAKRRASSPTDGDSSSDDDQDKSVILSLMRAADAAPAEQAPTNPTETLHMRYCKTTCVAAPLLPLTRPLRCYAFVL